MFHHVDDRSDWASLQPYCIRRDKFAEFLTTLEVSGLRAVSFNHAIREPNRRNVVVTFDDGAAHLWDFVIPELQKREMTATFLIPTHHIGKTNEWDVEEGRAEVQLMDEHQIVALKKAGMEVGGHSHHHVRLGEVDEEQVKEELRASKQMLDTLLNQDTHTLAWPYGSVPANAESLLKQTGWKYGLSIFSSKASAWSMRRFIVHNGDTWKSLRLKCSPLYGVYRNLTDRRKTRNSSRN